MEEKPAKRRRIDEEKEPIAMPLDHYTLQHIVDYTEAGMDHPFRSVCKGTREAWLGHPYSLPFRVRLELDSLVAKHYKEEEINYKSDLALHNRSNEERLLNGVMSALDGLREKIKEEKKRKKRKQKSIWQESCKSQILERALKSPILTGASEDTKQKEEDIKMVIDKIEEASLTMLHHHDLNTYAWRQWTIGFELDGYKMSYSYGADGDRCYPWGDSLSLLPPEAPLWEEMRAKWNITNLTAKELYDLMLYVLEVEEGAYKWQEEYD